MDATATLSPLTIREARDDELDIVASMIVDAYAEFAARMSPDAWSMFAHDIANVRGRLGDARLMVAERDGRLVGSVTVYPDWRGAQADAYGVRLLAVPPHNRGQGVAWALMDHVIEAARRANMRRVVMVLTPQMESAKELFSDLGFTRDPGLDHEPAPGVRMEGYGLVL